MGERTAWRVTTAPTVEPITLEDAKQELGIPAGDTSQDQRIARLITAARHMAEAFTNRAFIAQTITLSLDDFPTREREREPWWDGTRQAARSTLGAAQPAPIYLPRPPLIEVTGVAYLDQGGAPNTLDLDALAIDELSEPARIVPLVAWPATRGRLGVRVTYRAGYGATPGDVPPVITEAILAHVAATLEQPDATIAAESIDNASVTYNHAAGTGAAAIPSVGLRGNAQALLTPLRVRDLGMLHSPLS